MHTLLIADDHPLYRDALRGVLAVSHEQMTLLESRDLLETVELLHEHDIDLLLLDLHMPGSTDLYGLIHIRKLFPELPIAIVSGTEESELISKIVNCGAMGFIPKTSAAEQISAAVDEILDGNVWLPQGVQQINPAEQGFAELVDKVASLTPAQYKVLCLMRDGLLNKQIGYKLDIAEATVKAHVTAIFRKLEINNRTQGVLIASQLQLASPTE